MNRRTRFHDQERVLKAAELKLDAGESAAGETSFALTADVFEAYRQVHTDERN